MVKKGKVSKPEATPAPFIKQKKKTTTLPSVSKLEPTPVFATNKQAKAPFSPTLEPEAPPAPKKKPAVKPPPAPRDKSEIAELAGGGMLFPIQDGQLVEKPYQHPYFDTMLKALFFASSQSKGCKNPQHFEVVSVPLMAFLATALTKLLQSYSTGQHQKSNAESFVAEIHGPIFRGHLVALQGMVMNNLGGIREHLKAMITRARTPHQDVIARAEAAALTQATAIVPSVISASSVANFARRKATGRSAPSTANSDIAPAPPSLVSSVTTAAVPPSAFQATMMNILANGSLSEAEKAELLRRFCLDSSRPTEPPSQSNTEFYNNNWSKVDNANSDSEVEVERAGILLSEEQRAALGPS
ncbi:unnamed protein product [Rhizoctonia solani]|uniref:DUF6532 domain-containing protein n=1 Tax=Rhizoctonia solani TaxID=456999 RepID=A0A8H3DVW0_9AGAM|nr:unnamed protein product [Rhizoctonia solani]